MAQRALTVLALFFVLVGCDVRAVRHDIGLQRDIAHRIYPGMQMTAAEDALRKTGFNCGRYLDAGGPAGARTCARDRNYNLLESCIQRVELFPDMDKGLLRVFEVDAVVCDGP
jgi:hypothetical protein